LRGGGFLRAFLTFLSIHITKDFQKIEKSFGEIIDPGNLFKKDDFFEIQTSIAFEKIPV